VEFLNCLSYYQLLKKKFAPMSLSTFVNEFRNFNVKLKSRNHYHEINVCIPVVLVLTGPPLWSSRESSYLQIQRYRVRFTTLPDFLRSSGSGTESTLSILEKLLEWRNSGSGSRKLI
jgi:hypothetical protein